VCAGRPLVDRALSSWLGESGLSAGVLKASATRSTSSCSFAGRAPGPPNAGIGPRVSVRCAECSSGSSGSPACVISAAASAPADSAAASSRRPGSARVELRELGLVDLDERGERIDLGGSPVSSGENSASCCGPPPRRPRWPRSSGPRRVPAGRAGGRRRRRACAAPRTGLPARRGSRRRAPRRGTVRSRTPGAQQVGIQRVVSAQTQRGCSSPRSRRWPPRDPRPAGPPSAPSRPRPAPRPRPRRMRLRTGPRRAAPACRPRPRPHVRPTSWKRVCTVPPTKPPQHRRRVAQEGRNAGNQTKRLNR
jgi:hypothetical protein